MRIEAHMRTIWFKETQTGAEERASEKIARSESKEKEKVDKT